MPGFQVKLTEDELYAVVVFERVVFGGGNTEEVLSDCGLLETEEDEVTTEAVSSTLNEKILTSLYVVFFYWIICCLQFFIWIFLSKTIF